jgi:hypothetical protein
MKLVWQIVSIEDDIVTLSLDEVKLPKDREKFLSDFSSLSDGQKLFAQVLSACGWKGIVSWEIK